MKYVLPIINFAALVLTLVVNFLSQSGAALGSSPFPKTVAELGEARALFFLPAGYVFGIWGLIYTGLLAYVIYQMRPAQQNNPLIEKIGWWFVVSCIANSLWLVLFLYERTVESTFAMLVLLVSLVAIYVQLGIGRTTVNNRERWFVHIPFSIYLGWITVATVANIAAALYVSGNVTEFVGITADVWAVIMMVIAAIITFAMLIIRRDIAFALVIVWALVGIYVRPFNTPIYAVVANLNAGMVATAALGIALVIAAGALVTFLLQFQRSRSEGTQPQTI